MCDYHCHYARTLSPIIVFRSDDDYQRWVDLYTYLTEGSGTVSCERLRLVLADRSPSDVPGYYNFAQTVADFDEYEPGDETLPLLLLPRGAGLPGLAEIEAYAQAVGLELVIYARGGAGPVLCHVDDQNRPILAPDQRIPEDRVLSLSWSEWADALYQSTILFPSGSEELLPGGYLPWHRVGTDWIEYPLVYADGSVSEPPSNREVESLEASNLVLLQTQIEGPDYLAGMYFCPDLYTYPDVAGTLQYNTVGSSYRVYKMALTKAARGLRLE